ncbi:glycosyltransferase family 15 protein [Mycena galericulata]|nr:glycosyltransferase family 15 protein [Mycena galericulata]
MRLLQLANVSDLDAILDSGLFYSRHIWHEPPFKTPVPEKYYLTPNSTMTRRAAAAIVILAFMDDTQRLCISEAKFNRKFVYPYVFLNEEPFTEVFKREITALTPAQVQFGLIPKEDWFQPPWIDEGKASAARERMRKAHVLYGDSVSYRNMCRFQSGFFFRHELLKPFKYYWSDTTPLPVRPDVKFFCDLDYDPFLFMHDHDMKYAFTISLPEDKKTIRSLWPSVQEFMEKHPGLVVRDNALPMLLDLTGLYYNRCHFWSNFEIADLDLWRGESYMKFFEFLDSKGGFYYERWGDAPVHTFGAAMFLRKDQIHFFNDIGCSHKPFEHCPQGDSHARGKCECSPNNNFDFNGMSCLRKYEELFT